MRTRVGLGLAFLLVAAAGCGTSGPDGPRTAPVVRVADGAGGLLVLTSRAPTAIAGSYARAGTTVRFEANGDAAGGMVRLVDAGGRELYRQSSRGAEWVETRYFGDQLVVEMDHSLLTTLRRGPVPSRPPQVECLRVTGDFH